MLARTFWILMWGCVLAGPALAVEAPEASGSPYSHAQRAGEIEQIDFDGRTLVVDGYLYEVAVDANVEIASSYGAFTMLEKGMRIYFDYLVVSPTERVMVEIREIPDNVNVEQT